MSSSSPQPNQSGLQRWRNEIIGGFVLLSLIYFSASTFVQRHVGLTFQPAPQYCHGRNEPCSRPDLFAFQVSGFVSQIFLAGNGYFAWHHGRKPTTPHNRVFGFLTSADRMNAGILVYQLWDFVFSLAIPEHATPVFLAHHLAAALTAYFSLEYQMCHYYANFFGGCSELSTLFLVFCDFDVYFPSHQGGSTWTTFITVCQVCFVLTFLAYRVVGWWMVSYQLWTDALFVLRDSGKKDDDDASKQREKAWFLYVFLAMDVALGLLQVYWFVFGMLPKIVEILNA